MSSKAKLKVYLVGGGRGYLYWLPDHEVVKNVEDCDVVFFTGGADIDPSVYSQKRHPRTYSVPERDDFEIEAYGEALRNNKFIIGICRGAQLICAMQNQGMLIQHQENPGSHDIYTYDKRKLEVTSIHHQGMYPFRMNKKDYKILGWTQDLLRYHEGQNQEELSPPVECEIVYFPRVKGLAIQHHPEMMTYNHETNIWLRDLLNKCLNNKI